MKKGKIEVGDIAEIKTTIGYFKIDETGKPEAVPGSLYFKSVGEPFEFK
jgi:hypothetical protein